MSRLEMIELIRLILWDAAIDLYEKQEIDAWLDELEKAVT